MTRVRTCDRVEYLQGAAVAIYGARRAMGLSLRDAAKAVDIAPSYLSDIENDRRTPSDDVLRRLARLLGLDADDLAARAGRIGEPAQRLLRRSPALGALLRRMAETNATPAEIDHLATVYNAMLNQRPA